MQPLKPRTAEKAVGRWPGILPALGIDSKHLRKHHGPCPACGGRDRFRFDDKEGRGTWFCSHCGSGDGFALLTKVYGWDFKRAAHEVDRIVGTVATNRIAAEPNEQSKLQALRDTWRASHQVVTGDPVWRYLNQRVGIKTVSAALRLHPGMRHSDGGTYPVMLARMTYPDGTGASIHRTYLTPEGSKAPVRTVKKFMPGKPLNTSAVRLGESGECLGIAEGIETALAASLRFGLPVWAATNAGLLEAWVPPPGVRKILIAGDNDASFTGQAAAYALANRLVRDGYAVEIQFPPEIGQDWADCLPSEAEVA